MKPTVEALRIAADIARTDRDSLLAHARAAARRAKMYDQMLAIELATRPEQSQPPYSATK